jgi:putative FmdB family regulatory protein
LEKLLDEELFMPIYEYECEKCNHYFERLTFKGDDEHINCPKCGANKVKKLLSASSFMSKTGIGACSSGTSKGFS